MQSSLAIISFPIATAETAPPCVESTDQGFVLAFDEGLTAREGEIAPTDPAVVAQILPPLWLGPVLSVPAVVLSGIEKGGAESRPETEAAAVPGNNVPAPDLSQIIAARGIPELGAEEGSSAGPSGAIYPGPNEGKGPSLLGTINADLARMPSDLALQFEPTRNETPGNAQAGPWLSETHARPPVQLVNDAKTDLARGAESVASDTSEPTTVRARIVEGKPAENATRIALLRSGHPAGVDWTVDDQIVRSELSSAFLEPIDRDIKRTGQAKLAEIETKVSTGPDSPQTARQSIVEKDVERTSEPLVASLPKESLDSSTPLTSSFWERFFAGLTAPGSVNGLQFDQGRDSDTIVTPSGAIPATTNTSLPVQTPTGALGPLAIDSAPERPVTLALDAISAEGVSPFVADGPPSFPEKQSNLIPLIRLSERSDDLVDRHEQADPAPFSGPLFQSGSGSGTAPGPHGLASFPVQQVAVQIAGVMVDITDKATELALAPEELGRVSLRLEPDAANPDRMTILITVERPETLDLFRRHAGELAEAIRAAGYSGADIGFGQHGQGSSPNHGPNDETPGAGRPPEDLTPVSPARRDVVGASLDLRL